MVLESVPATRQPRRAASEARTDVVVAAGLPHGVVGGFTIAPRYHAQAFQEPLTKAPAQSQSDIGFQHHLVLSSVLQFQSVNPIQVYDDRAVNTDKLRITQVPFEFRQRPAN